MYSSFLLLMSQLSFGEQGKISLGSQEIYVRKHKGHWELSSKILFNESEFHRPSNGFLLEDRAFFFQFENVRLKKEPWGISLVQLVELPRQYTDYKKTIEQFLSIVAFWREENLNTA